MKLFFVNSDYSKLADEESRFLNNTREVLLSFSNIYEVNNPDFADAIIIQEKNSFKDFKYIDELLTDSLISKYIEKIFTINNDDCATGLLRGLYTCIPKSRFNSFLYVPVPYMQYPNELVFSKCSGHVRPSYLASWRGNTKSNKIRKRLISLYNSNQNIQLETTESWLNHQLDEKKAYVDLIQNAKFSLCPAGWAPVSFRIYESMALGRCPVIIADDFMPPQGPNWREFALFFPENNLVNLNSFLLQHEHMYEELGHNSYNAWKENFSTTVINKYYATALISLIQSTPKCSREIEVKRWKSLSLFWSNKWTIPQRVINKVKKMTAF